MAEDDLTDLEGSSDNETSCDLSACQSADPLTLVQRDAGPLRREDHPAPVDYQDNELVVEIERRRERDFGWPSESQSMHYRSSLPVIKRTSTTEQRKESETAVAPPPKALVEGAWSLHKPHPPTLSTGGDTSCHSGPAPSSPLTLSLFPDHLPPTIHFPLHNESCKHHDTSHTHTQKYSCRY